MYHCCRGGAHKPLRCHCECACPADFCKKCGYVIVDGQCKCNPHGHKETSTEMDEAIERYNNAKENGTLDRDFPVLGSKASETWEEEFDAKFYRLDPLGGTDNRDIIKAFIASKIAERDNWFAQHIQIINGNIYFNHDALREWRKNHDN